MSADIETVVVGAGIVGLAIARALAAKGQGVVVLERNGRAGAETSSRSSEVIHAGLYYPPGSLKARLCVAGKALLYRFTEANGVAVRRCGKLLVATSEDERGRLEAIAANARASGVTDLVALDTQAARRLEPELSCVAAVLSPSTGVIDSHGLLTALEGHVTSRGGEIVLNTAVTGVGRTAGGDFAIDTGDASEAGRITARNLVLAAGLGATVLGRMLAYGGSYRPPDTTFAKGHYYALTGGQAPFRHLVYPLPSSASLGIHLTLDIAGRARFGPDATWQERIDYGFDDEDGTRVERFARAVRRYWPGLPEGALAPDTTGIRPKIAKEGDPPADFAIHGPAEHGIPRLVALYGIESPGLTASLAIAEHVAGLMR